MLIEDVERITREETRLNLESCALGDAFIVKLAFESRQKSETGDGAATVARMPQHLMLEAATIRTNIAKGVRPKVGPALKKPEAAIGEQVPEARVSWFDFPQSRDGNAEGSSTAGDFAVPAVWRSLGVGLIDIRDVHRSIGVNATTWAPVGGAWGSRQAPGQ